LTERAKRPYRPRHDEIVPLVPSCRRRPAFEDANTGYGYLTWLNASSNHTLGGIIPITMKFQVPLDACSPVAVHREHPHGLSDSPDCNYEAPYSCEPDFDVGVWFASGAGG
jgi:hypothetical protein